MKGSLLLKSVVFACVASFFIGAVSVIPVWSGDLDEAYRLSEQALEADRQGKYKEAIALEEQALPIYKKVLGPDHVMVAIGFGWLGGLHKQLGDYQNAETLYKRALAIDEKTRGPDHPDVASDISGLAGLYSIRGDYQNAETLYKRALAIDEKARGPDHPGVAQDLNNLGALYYALGDPRKAEPFFKRALAIYEKAHEPDLSGMAHSLNGLAALYSEWGDYQNVEPFFKRALAIREKACGPNHPDVANSLNNLGAYYVSVGDFQKAEPLYKRALAIREKTLGPNHPEVALSLHNLAALYRNTGDYEKAESFFKKSLAIYERSFDSDNPNNIREFSNLAGLYLSTGKLNDAYSLLKKIDRRNWDVFEGLAEYHRLKGDSAKAMQEYFKAIDTNNKTGNTTFLIADHIGLGLAYEDQRKYPDSTRHFNEAIALIEKQWRTLPSQAKKNFMTNTIGIHFTPLDAYEGLISALLKENGPNAAKESFAIAERVKGRVFLEMLATRQLRGKTPLDASLIEKDGEFRQILLSLQKRIEVMKGAKVQTQAQELNALKQELAAKEKEYSTFIEEVKLKGGELASLLTVDPLSPSKLQALLDSSTTLLEYCTAKDKTYAWLVTKNDIKAYELPLTEKDLRLKVDTLLLPDMATRSAKAKPVMVRGEERQATTEAERQENRQHFLQVTRDFHKDILSPMKDDITTKNLIIVPHGVLHKVPFAALSDGQQYLVDKYSLSVLPAASTLQYVADKRKNGKTSVLTFANPTTDAPPLEYAEKEGETISGLFSTRELYKRDRATKTVAMIKSPSFNVIHFASHGEFNEKQPLQSGLILAKDGENDGFLQVHEIFSMDLKNANLVTLSACETALAKIQGGDDLVGLSRGFIYAGTPSLLATLWQVDDQSTALIMENFYKNWLKGMSKPEALRQAQMTLKNMPQYRHPYYWAAFEMIGDYQ